MSLEKAGLCTALVFLAMLSGAPKAFSQPLNLGFEHVSTEGLTRAWNWTPLSYAPGALVRVDTTVSREGRSSLRIARSDTTATLDPHAVATYMAPSMARGRSVELSGWTRSLHLAGSAYFTVQAWADFQILAADSAGISVSDSGWLAGSAGITVPAQTETLVVTVNLEGSGTVWFDGLRLEIDGVAMDALPVGREAGPDEIEWLARHVAPLRTTEPDDPWGPALDSLGVLIGSARVVALGESTHGTHEFFQLKHRVFAYLVRNHGFRVFAIEDQQLAMEAINRYVQGGDGTAEAAMRPLFGVWNREELRELIRWIRQWNDAHPGDTVEFVGFDMQNPSAPIDSLMAFAGRYDPALAPTLGDLLLDYREAWRRGPYPQYTVTDSVHHRWADGAEAAWRLVEARRTTWLDQAVDGPDSLAVEWAVQSARIAAQAGRYIFNDQPDRDRAMAANLLWRLDLRPGARAMVWAHDAHISRGRASSAAGNYFVSSMGHFLDMELGAAYRAIGLMSYDGTYTAVRSMWGGPRDLAVIDAFPAPVGSVESLLKATAVRLGHDALFLNVNRASSGDEGALLKENRPYRFVGYAAEDYGFAGSIQVAHQFDGLFFMSHTSGTRPLGVDPWPPQE